MEPEIILKTDAAEGKTSLYLSRFPPKVLIFEYNVVA